MSQETLQRRTVHSLMTVNAFGYGGFVAVLAVMTLLGQDLLGSDTLAGVPAAAATLGTALAASPLAIRSRRRGRRSGIAAGYVVGAVGAGLGLVAGQAGQFWVLVAAMFLFGAANASNLQNRFAAADLAGDERRARDIALVVWVGTIGGVGGPILARWANTTGQGFGLNEWVGPLGLGVIGTIAAAFVAQIRLRPDPLELAGGLDPSARSRTPLDGVAEAWRSVSGVPTAKLALIAVALSQTAMVAVMTMTPLHMGDHGHAEMSLLVMSLHVFGMFGLAPLVGRWADHFGRVRMLTAGGLTLGSGTVMAVVAGYVPALIFAGLFLLGLGWNMAFVAGSALLTESLPAAERVGAQGLSDVLMSALAALAAVGSGVVKSSIGYHWLANAATVAAIAIVIAAIAVERSRRVLAEIGVSG